MTIKTRDFGELEVAKKDIFSAKAAILGFDNFNKFVLIENTEIGEQIRHLQSAEERSVCFVLIHGPVISKQINFKITAEMQKVLSLEDKEPPEIFYIAVISDPPENSTVNLKGPLLFNMEKGLFAQFILDEDYPIRAPLYSFANEEG